MTRYGLPPSPDLPIWLPGAIWVISAAALVFLVARALAQAATLRLSGSNESALHSAEAPDKGAAGFRQILISILGRIDLWLSTPRVRQSSSGQNAILQGEVEAAFSPYTFVLKACLAYPLLLALLSRTVLEPYEFSRAGLTRNSTTTTILLLLCILSLLFASWAIREQSPRRMVGMAMKPALAIVIAGLVPLTIGKLAVVARLVPPYLPEQEIAYMIAASLVVLGTTGAWTIATASAGWLGAVLLLLLAALIPFVGGNPITASLMLAGASALIGLMATVRWKMASTEAPFAKAFSAGLGYSLAIATVAGLISGIAGNGLMISRDAALLAGSGMVLIVALGILNIGAIIATACSFRNWFAGIAPRLQTAFRQLEWLLMLSCVPAVALMADGTLSTHQLLRNAAIFMCLTPALLAPFVWLSLIVARCLLLRSCRPGGRFLLVRMAAIIPLTTGTFVVFLVAAAALAGTLYDLLPRQPGSLPLLTVKENIKLIARYSSAADYQVVFALLLSPLLPVALYVLALIVALSVRVLRPAGSGFGSEFLPHNAAALATACFTLLLAALWYILVVATDGFTTMIRIGLAIAHIVRGMLPI